jgi:hypothetical protein
MLNSRLDQPFTPTQSSSVYSLQIAIASVPLAVYFILIGAIRLRRTPLVTSGWRDLFALGLACSGLVTVGPMQLFFPTHAASRWPGWVWILMFGLYALGLLILALWSRPRLMAYGLRKSQFQEALLAAALEIDPQSSWYGEVLSLPNSGIQLSAESSLGSYVNSVGVVGNLQNLTDWLRLEKAFVRHGSRIQVTPVRSGWLLITAGITVLLISISPVFENPATAMVELRRFLFR